ncbi:MAG: hypothetical protein FK731_11565 [Asgard group archaeon]|nr:hypothetical protein [Asgard group archaeon]
MFKDLITKSSNNSSEVNNSQSITNTHVNIQLKFNEIICPRTKHCITYSKCSKCIHKKEYLRKHDLGLTLTTIICTWDESE